MRKDAIFDYKALKDFLTVPRTEKEIKKHFNLGNNSFNTMIKNATYILPIYEDGLYPTVYGLLNDNWIEKI